MTSNRWLICVCLAYILSGVKGFPKDDWCILYMWIGFVGLCALNYTKRQEYLK